MLFIDSCDDNVITIYLWYVALLLYEIWMEFIEPVEASAILAESTI